MSSHQLDDQMLITRIVPSSDNARVIDTKSQSFQELKESIKSGGVQIPIHVWPHPDKKKKGLFEIRCGERRWLACKAIGRKSIPAIVHRGIDYQTAMLLTMTENKFHEKLKPLEEVEEISRCMDKLNNNAAMIAVLIGQTEQWVRLRVNIHRNLDDQWRRAFVGHPHFSDWSIGHLTMIARLPKTSQKNLLKTIETRPWQWESVSVKDLDGRLSQELMLLIKAKWNLDDPLILPKAGACSACTKRSGSEPMLWFGGIKEQIKTNDRCLDPTCWKKKLTRYLEQRAKQFIEKFDNLTYRTLEHLTSDEKAELTEKFGRVYDMEDVVRSTSGAKNAIPSLVVSGKGAGMITFVKEKRFGGPATGKRPGKVSTLKERRAKLKAKRWAQVLILLIEKIDQAELSQLNCIDRVAGVMALSAVFGNHPRPCALSAATKEFDLIIKTGTGGEHGTKREKIVEYLWNSVKPTLIELISYGGPSLQIEGHYVKTARWLAKLLKVDIDKIFDEVSKAKGFLVPKTWDALNEDGTPKKKAAKKPKATKKSGGRGMIKTANAPKKPKFAKKKAGKTLKVDFNKSKKD